MKSRWQVDSLRLLTLHEREISSTLPRVRDSRVFVQVRGEGSLGNDAQRLAGQLDGLRHSGTSSPSRGIRWPPTASAPAIFLKVLVTDAKNGESRFAMVVNSCSGPDAWQPLGKVSFRDNSSISVVDGQSLTKAIDRAIAGSFVTVKPAGEHSVQQRSRSKTDSHSPSAIWW